MAHPYHGMPSHASRLLLLPIEIRLQILRYLVRADSFKFCPHTRLPLLVFALALDVGRELRRYDEMVVLNKDEYIYQYPRFLKYSPQPIAYRGINHIILPVLRVNRQLYQEAREIFYSENVFYLEQHFSMNPIPFGWHEGEIIPDLFQGISIDNLRLIRRIGFSVIDKLSTRASERDWRMWHDFRGWINKRLPNLEHTYIYLFGPSTPSQRFLVYIVRLLDAIPGQKTIVYRASNNRKRVVGNTLTQVFKNRRLDALPLQVLGGCYCQCWTPRLYANLHGQNDVYWTQANTLWPWLRNWNALRAANAIKGSVTPKFSFKHKGPMLGCLLCHKQSDCIHEAQLKPGRIKPDGDAVTARHARLLQ